MLIFPHKMYILRSCWLLAREMIISSPEQNLTLSYDVFWLQSLLETKYFWFSSHNIYHLSRAVWQLGNVILGCHDHFQTTLSCQVEKSLQKQSLKSGRTRSVFISSQTILLWTQISGVLVVLTSFYPLNNVYSPPDTTPRSNKGDGARDEKRYGNLLRAVFVKCEGWWRLGTSWS